MKNNTSTHSTDDDTCTACKKPASVLIECDHCSDWFCDSCDGLTPDIVSIMTTFSDAGLFGSALPADPSLNSLINHSLTLLPKHYPSYPPPPTHPLYPLSKPSPHAQHPLMIPHLTPHYLHSLLKHIHNFTLPKPPLSIYPTENPHLPYSPINLIKQLGIESTTLPILLL